MNGSQTVGPVMLAMMLPSIRGKGLVVVAVARIATRRGKLPHAQLGVGIACRVVAAWRGEM
jgi:hypothetical protein